MNTTTLVATARLRELIRLVLRWYLFETDKPHTEFHDSLVRLFVFHDTNKYIHLTTQQAIYLRGVLTYYKSVLMRYRCNLGRRFTLICVTDLLQQLETSNKTNAARQHAE